MSKTLFMETTRISAERTVSEIQWILTRYGATKIMLDFVASNVEGLVFAYPWEEKEIPFRLPCRWRELETMLRESGKRPRSDDTYEKWARRVAWRQILRWVEAQMALVETHMVQVQEVFLPYAVQKGGKTVYEKLSANGFSVLEYKGQP